MARIHTPEGTARFTALFKPNQRKNKRTGEPEGDPKHEITLIFDDPDELEEMKDAAMAVGTEKFGPKFKSMVDKGKYNWPFKDNTDMNDEDDNRYAGFENDDGQSIKFKSTDKPGIVDADAEPIMDKSEIYDGMRARVSCRPYAYDNESKGVAFILVNVQKLGEGKRLSGDPSAEDDFKPAKGKKPTGKTTTKGKPVQSSRNRRGDYDDIL